MLMLIALAAAAADAPPPLPKEAEIPFFSTVHAPDWQVDGEKGLWIRAGTSKWYYATFATPCRRAETAIGLGFKTFGSDTLDKFSTVYADGDICPLASLVESTPPPKPVRKHKG